MLAASQITDRAKRYRAHSPELEPEPPKQCGFCGSKRNVVPHHISGNEADLVAENLMWACKSCNTRLGFLYRDNGIGKRTVQYNPSKGTKREQMERYAAAIKVMRGQFEGDIGQAVSTIRSTPRAIRSAYTARTWPVRKQLYGESGRANPAVSAQQYRLAQAVLSGTARDTHMSEAAAREIVDRTPAKLRSKFMRNAPRVPEVTRTLAGAALYAPAAGLQLAHGLMGNSKRRNPERAAESAYTDFHGRPPETETIIETEVLEHSVLPGIGKLCWMVVRYETDDDEIQDVVLRKFNGALLCMNERRHETPQLFIEGG